MLRLADAATRFRWQASAQSLAIFIRLAAPFKAPCACHHRILPSHVRQTCGSADERQAGKPRNFRRGFRRRILRCVEAGATAVPPTASS